MATFHTHADIMSVPPPSDIELAMLDEHSERTRYDFNRAMRQLAICSNRWEFYLWLEKSVDLRQAYTLDDWRCFFNAFIESTDARDQRETLEDALR